MNVNVREPAREVVLRARDVVVGFGGSNILDHLDLDVYRGEVLGFVGGSGAGKSVLMRTIIGLVPKRQGKIEVFGVDLDAATEEELVAVEQRWGILFQQGALFPRSRCGRTSSFRCANISGSRSGCSTRSWWPSSAWSA